MQTSQSNQRQERCLKILNKFLVLAIIATSVYYVTVVNDLTVKGFKLQKLREQKQALKKENEQLSFRATSLRSYNNLAQRTKNLNMVVAGEIDYVSTMDGIMAKK